VPCYSGDTNGSFCKPVRYFLLFLPQFDTQNVCACSLNGSSVKTECFTAVVSLNPQNPCTVLLPQNSFLPGSNFNPGKQVQILPAPMVQQYYAHNLKYRHHAMRSKRYPMFDRKRNIFVNNFLELSFIVSYSISGVPRQKVLCFSQTQVAGFRWHLYKTLMRSVDFFRCEIRLY
jgi:hypothetical protein